MPAFGAHQDDDEDDGEEELCNCEFSLGYGGRILLNNTVLRLKRGRRYGLCGVSTVFAVHGSSEGEPECASVPAAAAGAASRHRID